MRQLGNELLENRLKAAPTVSQGLLTRRRRAIDRENQINRAVLEMPTITRETGTNRMAREAAHPSNALAPTGQGLVASWVSTRLDGSDKSSLNGLTLPRCPPRAA